MILRSDRDCDRNGHGTTEERHVGQHGHTHRKYRIADSPNPLAPNEKEITFGSGRRRPPGGIAIGHVNLVLPDRQSRQSSCAGFSACTWDTRCERPEQLER